MHLFVKPSIKKHQEKYQSRVNEWESFKNAGMDVKRIPEFVGFSRATYYRDKQKLLALSQGQLPSSKCPKRLNKRQWGESEKQLVLRLRRENPTYGKAKIAVILKRDHQCNLSESTIGRILKHLKEKGLLIKSASAIRCKRKRSFNKHAKLWTFKKYKDIVLGERIQIDHMSVSINGIQVKHFQAWDRLSKYMHAHAYSNATSRSAKRFLQELLSVIPFPILSIQVDGGSEFMQEFEDFCAEKQIPLLVLPPGKPTYNGGVERGNKTFKEEFYYLSDLQADSIGAIQNELSRAVNKYNHYRPHFALKGRTPMEYIQQQSAEVA